MVEMPRRASATPPRMHCRMCHRNSTELSIHGDSTYNTAGPDDEGAPRGRSRPARGSSECLSVEALRCQCVHFHPTERRCVAQYGARQAWTARRCAARFFLAGVGYRGASASSTVTRHRRRRDLPVTCAWVDASHTTRRPAHPAHPAHLGPLITTARAPSCSSAHAPLTSRVAPPAPPATTAMRHWAAGLRSAVSVLRFPSWPPRATGLRSGPLPSQATQKKSFLSSSVRTGAP